jgi:hypothetical protein
VATALTLQAGCCAAALRHPLVSAAFLAMSAANVTLLTLSTGLWQPVRPHSRRKAATDVAATILLAAMLTTGGVGVELVRGLGGAGAWARPNGRDRDPGALDSARAVMHELLYKDSAKSAAAPEREKQVDAGVTLGGDFPGVILWPEVSPVPLLIAPLPAAGGSFAGSRNPLSIPFGGEYWMYRLPDSRPPAGSYFRRASPAALTFQTTDHEPLVMEARQKLEQYIDVSCCGEIRVAIRNGDSYPGTVFLELILIDGGPHGLREQSLGEVPVQSVAQNHAAPVEETLSFHVGPSSSLRRFNQFTVKFHRYAPRKDKSARIAIERFVLVPKTRSA